MPDGETRMTKWSGYAVPSPFDSLEFEPEQSIMRNDASEQKLIACPPGLLEALEKRPLNIPKGKDWKLIIGDDPTKGTADRVSIEIQIEDDEPDEDNRVAIRMPKEMTITGKVTFPPTVRNRLRRVSLGWRARGPIRLKQLKQAMEWMTRKEQSSEADIILSW